MTKYLLDTNAYFAILKYVSTEESNKTIDKILDGECCISKVTQIEIISVIGKYARGTSGGVQTCNRIHKATGDACGSQYVIPKQKKWSQAKLKGWLKLEKEVSSGCNSLFNVKVLEINPLVIAEAEIFIQNALVYNFKSMDAMILGTAKANSTESEKMIVVTADKALKAGMNKIHYPHVSIT